MRSKCILELCSCMYTSVILYDNPDNRVFFFQIYWRCCTSVVQWWRCCTGEVQWCAAYCISCACGYYAFALCFCSLVFLRRHTDPTQQVCLPAGLTRAWIGTIRLVVAMAGVVYCVHPSFGAFPAVCRRLNTSRWFASGCPKARMDEKRGTYLAPSKVYGGVACLKKTKPLLSGAVNNVQPFYWNKYLGLSAKHLRKQHAERAKINCVALNWIESNWAELNWIGWNSGRDRYGNLQSVAWNDYRINE